MFRPLRFVVGFLFFVATLGCFPVIVFAGTYTFSQSSNDVYFASRTGGFVTTGNQNIGLQTMSLSVRRTDNGSSETPAFYFTISNGQYASGVYPFRRMQDATPGHYLPYSLYLGSAGAPTLITTDPVSTQTAFTDSSFSYTFNTVRTYNYNFSVYPGSAAPDAHVVYRDFVTVRVYIKNLDGSFTQLTDSLGNSSISLGINATFATEFGLNISSVGVSGTVDLGVIRNNEEVPFRLLAISPSSTFSMDIESQNGVVLKHLDSTGTAYDAVTSTIPYTVRFNGSNVVFPTSAPFKKTVVTNHSATSAQGFSYQNCAILLGASAVENLVPVTYLGSSDQLNTGVTLRTTAGKYQDTLTITIY